MRNFEALRYFMEHLMLGRSTGSVVEVFLQGEQIYRHICGFSDWENKIPLTGNELYNIYSCSKVATVTAAMQLVEQGKCHLDDPLYAYIPEYREMYIQKDGNLEKAHNPITLRHLFTMTAGLTYNYTSDAFVRARQRTNGNMDTLETIRCLASDPLSFEPGEQWQYSLCHDVLAAVVEVISGMKFRDYMRTYMFEPLQMVETSYHHTPETLERTAQQYTYEPDTDGKTDTLYGNKSGFGEAGAFKNVGKHNYLVFGPEYDNGGAGIITSVSDYSKLTAALANYGMGLTGERILKPESVDLLRQNALNPAQLKEFSSSEVWRGCGYGLGVHTVVDKESSGMCCTLGEFGWGGAAGSTVMVDPDMGLSVFFAQHMLNPREYYYQPRLRDLVYRCL